MNKQAIAVIDALGFKGIWKRVSPPEKVLAKLKDLADRALRIPDEVPSGSGGWIKFFSDTIVIWRSSDSQNAAAQDFARMFGGSPDVVANLLALRWVASACAQLIGIASRNEPHEPRIVYRGAIAFGELADEDPFLLGPAIDEAAEAERMAEAAVVWLCPSAAKVVDAFADYVSNVDTPGCAFLARGMLAEFVPNCSVPMKGGHQLETYAIAPHSDESMLEAFGQPSRIDVAIKKQHTAALMETFKAWRAERVAELSASGQKVDPKSSAKLARDLLEVLRDPTHVKEVESKLMANGCQMLTVRIGSAATFVAVPEGEHVSDPASAMAYVITHQEAEAKRAEERARITQPAVRPR